MKRFLAEVDKVAMQHTSTPGNCKASKIICKALFFMLCHTLGHQKILKNIRTFARMCIPQQSSQICQEICPYRNSISGWSNWIFTSDVQLKGT